VKSEVQQSDRVVELVVVAGRMFVLRRYGDAVQVKPVPPRPAPVVTGLVVPFRARGG